LICGATAALTRLQTSPNAVEAALAMDQATEDVVEEADHQLRAVVIRTCIKAAVVVGAATAITHNARFAAGMTTLQIGAGTCSMKTLFPTQDTALQQPPARTQWSPISTPIQALLITSQASWTSSLYVTSTMAPRRFTRLVEQVWKLVTLAIPLFTHPLLLLNYAMFFMFLKLQKISCPFTVLLWIIIFSLKFTIFFLNQGSGHEEHSS
jgi:hypothetical protein